MAENIQRYSRGATNPFTVVTTTDTYSANYGDLVISEGGVVELPEPQQDEIIGVRNTGQYVELQSVSGLIQSEEERAVSSGVEETVYLVSDGVNWYTISDQSLVTAAIPDSGVLNQADSVWWADEGSGELVSDSESNDDGTINNVDWKTGQSTGSTKDQEGGIYLNFFDGNVDFGSIYTGGDFFHCIFARPTEAGGSNYSVFGDSDPDNIFGVDLNSSDGSWRAWLNGESDDSNVNAKEDVWAMACLTFSDDTNAGRLFVYEVGSDPEQIVNISVDGDGNDVNIADFLWGEDANIDKFRGDLDFGVFGSSYLSESDVEEHWNAYKENYE